MRLVIGIPTVPRKNVDYLEETVRSVLAGVRPALADSVELVVLNGAPTPGHHAAAVRVAARVRDGSRPRVTVIENPAGHPTLAGLPAGGPGEHRWATKLTLDCALLMEACVSRGDLYLHLEDDVIAAADWFTTFTTWFAMHFATADDHERAPAWGMLCLYHPLSLPDRAPYPLAGFHMSVGLLFRMADLPALIAYLRRRVAEAPLDWLVRDWLLETNQPAFVHTPSLFQHVGIVSSNANRLQLVEAPTFEESWLARQKRLALAVRTVILVNPRRGLGLLRARVRKGIAKLTRS